MTSSRTRCVVTTLVLLLTASNAYAQRTAQDIESARQLYNQGIELRDKGDLKGALDKLRAAHALGNTPITGIELCRTHAALHQPVEAREVCLGVARIPPTSQETARSQEARTEAAKIAEEEKGKIGALRMKITGVPKGQAPIVQVDGVTVPPAALGQPRAVNPGTHAVSARVGSGVETKATLDTKEGETRDIELIVQAPAEAPPPVVGPGPTEETPRESAKHGKSNSLATVSFVVGGVAAIVGVGSGIAAMSGESDLAEKCTNKLCGREYHDDLDSAKSWGNVSTASFIIAGLAVGVGLVSTLLNSSSSRRGSRDAPARTGVRVTPTIGLGGAGFHGSF